MADPTGYEPQYSFTGFQVNSPSSPLPAPPLDNELLNIALAVMDIVAAVKDVRRSDGALKNQIVTFDSLALELQLTFDPTNGQIVAAAIEDAQASAAAALASQIAAANSAAAALTSAIAAAASASSVNLTLFLPKAGNLAGLGSPSTSRANLGLGSVATFDVGGLANNIVQLDAGAKIPAYDGSQLTNIDILPVGATILVNDTNAPPGFLKENGALISRASFPRLAAYALASGNIVSEASWAGGNFGAFSTGDLSTTIRLPDARGEFIRGWDNGRGADIGRAIGAFQADSLKDHTHDVTAAVQSGVTSDITAGALVGAQNGTRTTGSPSTGAAAETRPRNIAKLACIKY